MQPVYISSAYLGPVQQYCKLYQFEEVRIETAENYLKQTYPQPLYNRGCQRSAVTLRPHRQARHAEMPDEGYPHIRPRELAPPALECTSLGL